jgi:hypothetical protein
VRVFTLICLLAAASFARAQELPTDIFDGMAGALTPSDYHEAGVNLPVDWQELCLTHGVEYEAVMSSWSVEVFLYVQDANEPISRSRAWSSARGREILDFATGMPYYKASLHFGMPPGTTWCHEVYVVASVYSSDGAVYGAYRVELSQH